MHRDEADELLTCLECGTELTSGADRDFEFGTYGVLCWACASQRGGVYDEDQARWVQVPDVADLESVAFEAD